MGHPCNTNGTWGITEKLVPGGNGEISMQVDFSKKNQEQGGERPGSVYTVQFIVRPDQPIDNLLTDPYIHPNAVAYVDFSASGNVLRRQFSIGEGKSISGVADHIAVRVKDATSVRAGTVGGRTYSVTILVTKGTRGGDFPVFLSPSAPFDLAPGTSTSHLPIATELGVCSIRVDSVNLDGNDTTWMVVSCFDCFDNAVGSFVPGKGGNAWIPLPPGTQYFTIENMGLPGSGTVRNTIYFGIDG